MTSKKMYFHQTYLFMSDDDFDSMKEDEKYYFDEEIVFESEEEEESFFFNRALDTINSYFDDFVYELKHADALCYNDYYIAYDIYNECYKVFSNFLEAFWECLKYADDFEIYDLEGVFTIKGANHDGRNLFEIKALNWYDDDRLIVEDIDLHHHIYGSSCNSTAIENNSYFVESDILW